MSTENINVISIDEIISPVKLKSKFPSTNELNANIKAWRSEIASIINGHDTRFLVIIGPCSIHDVESAYDYAEKLATYRAHYNKTMCIVMRVYFEKPRTTVGWKGLINDPHMDGTNDINCGLETARLLLLKINELGLPVACEFLDVFTPQYLADLVSWGAIGARTTESQLHRELASGLSPPIGFKNGTDGNIGIATDAIICASSPHTFLGIDENGQSSIVKTKGNSTLHVILRGSSSGPNYSPDHIKATLNQLAQKGIKTKIVVDCSHGNSAKNFRNQPLVLNSLLEQIKSGTTLICGIMVESNIVEGNQKHKTSNGKQGLIYGQSVTDECINLETTHTMFEDIHEVFSTKNEFRQN